MQRTERGQALPLLALVIVVGGMAVVLLGRIGGAAVERARASAAADAAALAGAAEGRSSAQALAGANGGRLVRYEELGDDVRVRARVGLAEASARAERGGGGGVAPGGRAGVEPALLAALARADQVLGGTIVVTGVHRSGTEVTLAPAWAERAAPASTSTGLCRADGADPLRFTVCR